MGAADTERVGLPPAPSPHLPPSQTEPVSSDFCRRLGGPHLASGQQHSYLLLPLMRLFTPSKVTLICKAL